MEVLRHGLRAPRGRRLQQNPRADRGHRPLLLAAERGGLVGPALPAYRRQWHGQDRHDLQLLQDAGPGEEHGAADELFVAHVLPGRAARHRVEHREAHEGHVRPAAGPPPAGLRGRPQHAACRHLRHAAAAGAAQAVHRAEGAVRPRQGAQLEERPRRAGGGGDGPSRRRPQPHRPALHLALLGDRDPVPLDREPQDDLRGDPQVAHRAAVRGHPGHLPKPHQRDARAVQLHRRETAPDAVKGTSDCTHICFFFV